MAALDGVIPAIIGAANVAGGSHQVDRSLRFNSADSAYLNRTPSSAGNRRTFTFSAWLKRSTIGGSDRNALFNVGTTISGNSGFFGIRFQTADTLNVTTGSTNLITTTRVFRDLSAWYHIVVTGDTTLSSNQFKIYVNGALDTQGGSLTVNTDLAVADNVVHEIGRTTWSTNEYLNGYLAEVHFIDGQALAPTDFGEYDDNNVWQPKAYSGSYGTNGFYLKFDDNSSNAALGTDSSGNNNTWTVNNINAKGSDWDQSETWSSGVTGSVDSSYPATNMFDGDTGLGYATGTRAATGYSITWTPSTAITGVNTLKIGTYANIAFTVNGSSVPAPASIGLEVSIDKATYFPDGILSNITWAYNDGSNYVYITYIKVNDILLVDAGVPDTNAKNIDSLIDSPTNYTAASGNNGGNYATLNPLALYNATLGNGNLEWTLTDSSLGAACPATIAMSSGKYYCEVVPGNNTDLLVGLIRSSYAGQYNYYVGYAQYTPNTYGYYQTNGQKYVDNVNSAYGDSYAEGDVIGMAYDGDNNTITFYKNNVSQGAISVADDSYHFAVSFGSGTSGGTPAIINFGQRPFVYTPPTGYVSLCTENFPNPTIADGSTAMDIALYTGNGSTQSITGLGFNPDLVWIKSRSDAHTHVLTDSVRGTSSQLFSNLSDSQGSQTDQVTAFNSDGFSLGANAGGTGGVNINTTTYVGWAWDSGTTTVSNTDGSITSSVRANASAGFSIVSYTGNQTNGATVGHGLNSTPLLLLAKNRDASESWLTLHQDSSDTWWAAQLNTTTQFYDLLTSTSFRAQSWDNTPPTSSVFQLADDNGNWNNTLNNNQNYIVYCFAPVEGYSAFGSYTGNGSSDGPFVYTGFRPNWILVRQIDATQNWVIIDAVRNTFNIVDNGLYADLSNAEQTSNRADFTANGFKIRINSGELNTNAGSYFYAAFAEHPFKTARAR